MHDIDRTQREHEMDQRLRGHSNRVKASGHASKRCGMCVPVRAVWKEPSDIVGPPATQVRRDGTRARARGSGHR